MTQAPTPFIQGRRMGREGEPLVVIDDFHPAPERLRADAAAGAYAARGKFYPGVRAAAPAAHLAPCQALLADVLEGAFGVTAGVRLTECNFSLVTTRPENLLPMQRLPHYDGVEPGRFALLHYLCGPDQGATAFYRHRSTGFETVTADRFEAYRDRLQAEIDGRGGAPEAEYFSGDDALFERIDQVEAKFNRAVLYRGVTLHSGAIPADFAFSDDPMAGRLTVNSFFAAR